MLLWLAVTALCLYSCHVAKVTEEWLCVCMLLWLAVTALCLYSCHVAKVTEEWLCMCMCVNSKIGEDQSAEDAEDGPPELLVINWLILLDQSLLFHLHHYRLFIFYSQLQQYIWLRRSWSDDWCMTTSVLMGGRLQYRSISVHDDGCQVSQYYFRTVLVQWLVVHFDT